MNLHYSLYESQHTESAPVVIDLSQVAFVELGLTASVFWVNFRQPDANLCLDLAEHESFLSAWNRYKYAAAAAQLIKIPEQANPTVACNSAMRIDEYLGFLAGEKLKELAELAEEKAA